MNHAGKDRASPALFCFRLRQIVSHCQEGNRQAGQNIPIANPCVYTSTREFSLHRVLISICSEVYMRAKWMVMNRRSRFENFSLMLAMMLLILLCGITPASAQDQSQAPPQDNTQNNGRPKQDVPPDAGGPTGDMGPYAIPEEKSRRRSPASSAARFDPQDRGHARLFHQGQRAPGECGRDGHHQERPVRSRLEKG